MMVLIIIGMILMLTLVMMQNCCDVMFDLILFSTYFDKCALYQLVESVIWSDRQSDVTGLSNTDLWEFSPSASISPPPYIFSPCLSHIQQNPGGNKGLRMQCTDRRFKTGFCLGRQQANTTRNCSSQEKEILRWQDVPDLAPKTVPCDQWSPSIVAEQSDNVPIYTLLLLW